MLMTRSREPKWKRDKRRPGNGSYGDPTRTRNSDTSRESGRGSRNSSTPQRRR